MSISRGRPRAPAKAGAVVAAAGILTVLTAAPALAHVETAPGAVPEAKIATVIFRVPNELPDAGTVSVRLDLPQDYPVPIVRARSTAGWTAAIVKAKLDKPVQSGNVTLTEAYRTVTWTAAPGTRIGPGEFGEFAVTLGPMPEGTDTFIVNAVQTYDDGTVVNWNQPPVEGEPEPENPAPTLTLTAKATDDEPAAARPAPAASDDTALWVGGAGLALGALALGIAVGTALRARRPSTSATEGPAS